MKYVFHPAAEAELLESIAFYEAQSKGLGAAFLSEFEQTVFSIYQSPKKYKVERTPDIRRALLSKFPFSVIFRDTEDEIQVLALAHQRRSPMYWFDRSG